MEPNPDASPDLSSELECERAKKSDPAARGGSWENRQALRDRLRSPEGLMVAGVLSGTSADGIDVGLVRFCEPPSEPVSAPVCLAFQTLPFPGALGDEVRRVLAGGKVTVGGLARLHIDLGRAFGDAVEEVSREAGIPVHLVGSHGQTVWHFDGQGAPGTWQLGEGNQVAAGAQAPCVADFRSAHIAVGGHGAPLSICADRRLFGHLPGPTGILNLGGMGNISWLPEPDGDSILGPVAFDTGPAGALLDGLARHVLKQPMDFDGAMARRGRVMREWVRWLLAPDFFRTGLPRSTGRDTFDEHYVEEFLRQAGPQAKPEDLLASAVQAVAQSVREACDLCVGRSRWETLETLWVAGGGARNPVLMEALEREMGLPVRSSEGAGVDPDAREALLFACLAVDFLVGRAPDLDFAVPGDFQGPKSGPLGKWCEPPLP